MPNHRVPLRRKEQVAEGTVASQGRILDIERRGAVTLLYSARDVLHNGAVVLRDYLVERRAEHPRRGKREGHRFTSRTTGATKHRDRSHR